VIVADEVFTSGTWVVQPGHEDEFIAAWTEFAHWTKATTAGAGWVYLLRDEERPNRFVSFGPWRDGQSVQAWRDSAGFGERIGRIRSLLESFEASRLTPVVHQD
jgi:heme-degrading monooxygenase HmoA